MFIVWSTILPKEQIFQYIMFSQACKVINTSNSPEHINSNVYVDVGIPKISPILINTDYKITCLTAARLSAC